MNGDALSKVYTFEHLVNRVLSRIGKKDPEAELIVKIGQEINAKQKTLAESLRKNESIKSLYETPASISFTGGECSFNQVETVNPVIVEPLRVNVYRDINGTQTLLGEVPKLGPSEFENAINNEFYKNSLVTTFKGRKILIFAGENMDVTQFTFKFIYIREVNTLAAKTDYMDLPNANFDDLVNEVELIFKPAETKKEEV